MKYQETKYSYEEFVISLEKIQINGGYGLSFLGHVVEESSDGSGAYTLKCMTDSLGQSWSEYVIRPQDTLVRITGASETPLFQVRIPNPFIVKSLN